MDTDEDLLRFLYLCPVGLAEIDETGAIQMLNALGSQLLMPLAADARLDNLFVLLEPFDVELRSKVDAHKSSSGQVCTGHRATVTEQGRRAHLDFTVIRLDPNRLMVAFSDVTRLVEAERAARDAVEIQARQAGKLEVASGVLHDIGNAVTGLGARSARLNADTAREELHQLQRLGMLVESNMAGLSAALGGPRAAALRRFIDELCAALRARFDDWEDSARLFTRTVAHIQEILNIQRAHAGSGAPRLASIPFDEVLRDVLSVQSGAIDRRAISVSCALDPALPGIVADRTKLVQVLLNLVKNACEAFDDPVAPSDGRRVTIAAKRSNDHVEIEITDNGGGFDPGAQGELMQRGRSHKPGGSGLGLAGARDLIHLHGGALDLESRGPGLGATARITLPLREDAP